MALKKQWDRMQLSVLLQYVKLKVVQMLKTDLKTLHFSAL